MKMRVVFGLPWRGPYPHTPWIMALAALAMWSGAALVLHTARPLWPAGWLGAGVVLAFWLAAMGVLLGSMVRLAFEARRLCLPGLERATALSVCLNALALWVVTAIALAVLSGHPAPLAELLAIGLAAGIAYALLPFWVVALALLLVPLLQALATSLHWRGIAPQDPRFIEVCVAFVTPALLFSAWNWRRVLQHAHRPIGWFTRPIMLFATWTGRAHVPRANPAGGVGRLSGREIPLWRQPQVALHEAGPADLSRALRIALGGPYLPLTPASTLRRISPQVGVIGVLALLFLPVFVHPGASSRGLRALILGLPVFGLGIVLMIGTVTRATHLIRRWRMPGGELAVLALLPRSGAAREQAARLRRVLFSYTRLRQLPLIAATVLVEALLTPDVNRTLLLALVLGLAPAAEVAVVYATLGRVAVPPWGYGLMTAIGQLVFVGGMNVATFSVEFAAVWLRHAAFAATLLCYFGFATLSGLGRRAAQRLPHPYLGLD